MNEIPRVKVVNPNNSWMGTHYYINDKEIEKVKSVDFHVGVDEVPTFVFETLGIPNIEMGGNIRFDFTPKTIIESIAVLRNELLKHSDFYEAFIASIESSLREQDVQGLPFGDTQQEIAEKILNRIIGEDMV